MSFRILVINCSTGRSYRTIQRLPGADLNTASRELIARSRERVAPVVLRDGSTGHRMSVGEAMDHHGLSFIDRWQPQQWLERTARAAA
jgi:hypothetical protein